ncbi:hypothetical protein U1763_16410 [Sphingomonas sp. LB2R24]|uniref:hypothetical protein n=1 Tax=Sphingomonas sorbitolis TaxID=3096165 RepID=UPI002FCACF3D
MSTRRTMGAVAGGLVAGLAITALLMRGEKTTGTPSELVDLERTTARKLGLATPPADRLATSGEQAIVQGGHLLLSAGAAIVYAAATDEDSDVLVSGIGFGLAFYGAMHWLVGPLLGVKPPEWDADSSTIGLHTLNHVGFGLATAAGAKLAARA